MPTLAEAVRLFMQIERAPSTVKNYDFIFKSLIDHFGADTDLATLTEADMIEYLQVLRAQRSPQGKPLKTSTVTQYIRMIKALLSWAVTVGHLPHSPADHLRIRKQQDGPERARAIPPDDLNALLDVARYHPRNYALLLFLADTGCRVGGLVSLRLKHLDLEKRTAWLYEKGGRWHQVYFGEKTAEALTRWLAKRPAVDHDYVWTASGQHQPIARSAVQAIVHRLCEKVGTSRIWSPHSIRHAVGHSLAKAGVPLTAIQRKLGHANPQTTMLHYQPKDDAYLREISETLSLAALGDNPPTPPPTPTPEPPAQAADEDDHTNIIQRDDWRKWRGDAG